MKVTGGATVHAPIATVWNALTDPAVLVRAIPGCERLTATAQDAYELTVTAGVGTITGTYTGEIALTGQQPPTALTLRANGSGSPGTVTTSVRVRLDGDGDGDGATRVSYDADAAIGGLIAGVGQRMLAGAARRQATQFFTALDDLLLARVAEEAGAAPAGAGGAGRVAHAGGAAPAGAGGAGRVAHAGGAAGVAPPAGAAAQGVPGMTWEPPAAPDRPAARLHSRPPAAGFLEGVLVGAGVALAGVVAGGLIARRKH